MKASWMLGLTLVVGCGAVSGENGPSDAGRTSDAPGSDGMTADRGAAGGGGTGGSTQDDASGGGSSPEDATTVDVGPPDAASTPDSGSAVDVSRPDDVVFTDRAVVPDARQDTATTIDSGGMDIRSVDTSVPDAGKGGTGGTGGSAGAGGTGATGGTGGSGGIGGTGGTGGTGGIGVDAPIDVGCPAETDQQFCTRLGKNCETVTDVDNCGATRDVNCGTCGVGKGCVEHVCKTPVCTSLNFTSEIYVPLSTGYIQDMTIASSANAQSLFYATSPSACATPNFFMADETSPGSGSYIPVNMTTWWNSVGASWAALSGDGLTIVVSVGKTYGESSRPALGAVNFAASLSMSEYNAINAFLAGSTATLRGHAISTSGLEFFYSISGVGAGADGVYRSTRASTSSAFSAGTRMTTIDAVFDSVSGISSDGLALFVNQGYAGAIFTRNSTSVDFSNPNGTNPPPAPGGWHHKPGPGCKLFGTNTSGGCSAQDIWLYTPQ